MIVEYIWVVHLTVLQANSDIYFIYILPKYKQNAPFSWTITQSLSLFLSPPPPPQMFTQPLDDFFLLQSGLNKIYYLQDNLMLSKIGKWNIWHNKMLKNRLQAWELWRHCSYWRCIFTYMHHVKCKCSSK